LEGRVKRRLRRHRLSEEINSIELDKKIETKTKNAEVQALKEQLAAKDLEVQRLHDEQDIASQIVVEAGANQPSESFLSTKVHDLEDEIRSLKAQLASREDAHDEEDIDWTLAARDPSAHIDDDDDNMITNYDFEIDDTEIMTTPTRLNTSFPSPPSTIPNTPNTPSRYIESADAGVQVALSNVGHESNGLQEQLRSLQSELDVLNNTALLSQDHQERLITKLADFLPSDESHDHTTLDAALDKVLTTLALSQSQCIESAQSYDALSTCITTLGFTAASPDAALEVIHSQFRKARLELEYIMPGETEEGFDNSKLLELLIVRVRTLVRRVSELDEQVDQYHEQETSLRQQLNARVSAMDALKADISMKHEVLAEKDTSIERLQSALNGYREEVSSLENLVGRIESDGKEVEAQLRSEIQETQERLQDEVLKHDVTRAEAEGKDILLIELERRLSTVLDSMTELETQLTTLSSTNTAQAATVVELEDKVTMREKAHGSALALRDARVTELRQEIDRVNDALRTAHVTIMDLRNSNSSLTQELEGEKSRGMLAVQAMRDQLSRALDTGSGYVRGHSIAPSERSPSAVPETQEEGDESVRRNGRFLDAGLARRRSGKRRRRYDSGLGFLDEEEDRIEDSQMEERCLSREVGDAVDAIAQF